MAAVANLPTYPPPCCICPPGRTRSCTHVPQHISSKPLSLRSLRPAPLCLSTAVASCKGEDGMTAMDALLFLMEEVDAYQASQLGF